jgi:hypothetical protein
MEWKRQQHIRVVRPTGFGHEAGGMGSGMMCGPQGFADALAVRPLQWTNGGPRSRHTRSLRPDAKTAGLGPEQIAECSKEQGQS